MHAVSIQNPATEATPSILSKFGPDAKIWLEKGTFFVGIQKEFGVHVLGWGPTVKKAVDHATEVYEG